MIPSTRPTLSVLLAILGAAVLAPPALAQTGRWDSLLSDSHWYVPVPQLLAYGSSSTSFAQPIPMGDQTTWSFGTAVNGVFSGSTTATPVSSQRAQHPSGAAVRAASRASPARTATISRRCHGIHCPRR